MIDPTVRNVNRQFVPSFRNGNNHQEIIFLFKHYMPLVEVKDFNVSIENESIFDQPVKNKQETY